MIPIQERYEPARQLVGWHELGRCRTSYGDPDETIEFTSSRIIYEDYLISFKSGLESTYENTYADAEMIIRTEFEQAFVVSCQNAVKLANSNMDREQVAMGERMKQFIAATEHRVQIEVAAAQEAFVKAENLMYRKHANDVKRVVALHNEAFVANEAILEEMIQFQCEVWRQFEQVQQ